jgi:NitT/TauT family transport system substrate-binding protein
LDTFCFISLLIAAYDASSDWFVEVNNMAREKMSTNEGSVKPTFHNVVIAFVSLIALLFVLISFFWMGRDKKALKVGYSPYSVNVPLFVAADKKLFEEEGLKVELIPFQSTDLMATALESGQVDLATALAAEAVYSINDKSPDLIRPFFFNIFLGNSSVDAIVVLQNSTISSMDDLAGKKIGILPANMMRVALRQFLSKVKVDPDKLELVTLPPTSVLSALSSREVDAIYILEPLVTIACKKLTARTIAIGVGANGIADPLPAGFHCIRSKLLDNNPELGAKLAKVYGRAAAMAESSRSIAQKTLQDYCALESDISEAVALPSWSVWTPELQKSLRAQFEALQPTQGWGESVFQKTIYLKVK